MNLYLLKKVTIDECVQNIAGNRKRNDSFQNWAINHKRLIYFAIKVNLMFPYRIEL